MVRSTLVRQLLPDSPGLLITLALLLLSLLLPCQPRLRMPATAAHGIKLKCQVSCYFRRQSCQSLPGVAANSGAVAVAGFGLQLRVKLHAINSVPIKLNLAYYASSSSCGCRCRCCCWLY